jgi:hypothetical protein
VATAATPTASALLTGPSFAGHARPAGTGRCSWRLASCSPLISRTPHDPQKRFPGGFSWRHRGHETCCSVMFVSSCSRRHTGLYTNADRNAPSSRFGARSTLLNPHPGYQDPSPWLQRRSSITYGNLAEFSVLDTRQYRDDQAAGGGVDPPNSEQKDPSRSITGEAQERWLFEGLSRSRSRWNVLAQQVFFAQRDLKSGPGESFAMDAWDGYLGSRNRILDFIAERRIANPIVITGDVHNNWAADLKADFNDPNSPTVGTEFVGTSITSGGHGADTNQRAQGIIAQNPHLTFFNGQRGYIRCVLTPESFRADYRVLPFVSRRGAPIHTRASFEVADGQPGAQQVGGEPIPTPPTADWISAAIELDSERIEAQKWADRGHDPSTLYGLP